jgi:hypothetical protein
MEYMLTGVMLVADECSPDHTYGGRLHSNALNLTVIGQDCGHLWVIVIQWHVERIIQFSG